MKQKILNYVYNSLIAIGIIVMTGMPISLGENVFRKLANGKLHYVSAPWLLYILLLLTSLILSVLAYTTNEPKKETAYTQKSLAFFTAASFVLAGFGSIVEGNNWLCIPFIVCFLAIMVYRLVSNKDE